MAVSVKLDDELKDKVQSLAESQGRSAHWVMREAIKEYVERQDAKESFKKEALLSWKVYQETGQHLSGDEVKDWLDTWGTDKETEIPECHD